MRRSPRAVQRGLLWGAGLALILTMGAIAAAATLAVEARPAVGGTYREAVVGQPRSFNPLLHPHDPLTQDVSRLIHAGLVRVTDAGEIRGELASGWTTSPDGLVYSFTLDPRARWPDGKPLTSADVLATLDYVRADSFSGAAELASLWRGVGIDIVGDRVVRFTLSEPYTSFIEACAMPILSADDLQSGARRGSTGADVLIPTGAGPFRVESVANSRIVLRRNSFYVGPGPWLDRIELHPFPTLADAVGALRAGEVDGLAGLSSEAAAEFGQPGGHFSVHEVVLYGHELTLVLNNQAAVLADGAVRRAIALALSREAILGSTPGWGVLAFGPIPASSWAYAKEIEGTADPVSASRILDEAGWVGTPVRSRQGRPLALPILVQAGDRSSAAAQVVAAQLRAIGFQADVREVDEIDLYREWIIPRTYEAVMLGVWLNSVDPDPYWLWHSGQRRPGFNIAELADARVDALIETARRDGDPTRRRAALTEFQRRWNDDAPSVVLGNPVMRYVLPSDLQGVRLGTLMEPSARFQHVAQWHVQTQRAWFFTP